MCPLHPHVLLIFMHLSYISISQGMERRLTTCPAQEILSAAGRTKLQLRHQACHEDHAAGWRGIKPNKSRININNLILNYIVENSGKIVLYTMCKRQIYLIFNRMDLSRFLAHTKHIIYQHVYILEME